MIIDSPKIININTAEIIGTMGIVTIRCSCIKREILMTQIGVPVKCPSCSRIWNTIAKLSLKIEEVFMKQITEEVLKTIGS